MTRLPTAVRRTGAVLAGALLAAAPWAAQGRSAELNGIVPGELDAAGAAELTLSLAPGEAVQVDVQRPLGSTLDLRLEVRDEKGTVLQQDDDNGGDSNPRVLLYSETARNYVLRVDRVSGDGAAFDVLVRPSRYRPLPPKLVTFGASEDGELLVGFDQLFYFDGRAGQVVVVDLAPAGESLLDPALELYEGEGLQGPMLAANDDAGGTYASRIRQTLPRDGRYTARALSGPAGRSGAFRFALREVDPASAERALPLPLGEDTEGQFGLESNTIEDTGTPYQLYSFDRAALEAVGRAGEKVEILMRVGGDMADIADPSSEDFDTLPTLDPYLELGIITPLGFVALLTDDDSGGGYNARLELQPSLFSRQPDLLAHLRVRASARVPIDAADYVLAVRAVR